MTTPILQQQLEERIHCELPHLTEQDRCVLVRITERLVEAYQPDRIYLFGSKARGDCGPDSDFDLMVVVPQTDESGYRLAQQAHSLLWDIGTAADILVWSQHAFESRLHLRTRGKTALCRVMLHVSRTQRPGYGEQRLICVLQR